MRIVVREIVKNIVNIFKSNDEGLFTLNRDDYFIIYDEFIKIVLSLDVDNTLDSYNIDGNFYQNEKIIFISITYNRNKKNKLLYNIIGELNEVVRHELEHLHQDVYKTHDLNVNEPSEPFNYYSQPHEIEAQVKGFKRLAKLTKQPLEKVIRNWFNTHKDIHLLSEDEIEIIINLLLFKSLN